MTTNKKDQTEDILEKVKDVLEKMTINKRLRYKRSLLFLLRVSLSINLNFSKQADNFT